MADSEILELGRWALGVCVTGFFFLCGCIWWVSRQLPDAKKIAKDLGAIKDALLGTMDKQGFISKLYSIESDVEELKEKVHNVLKG